MTSSSIIYQWECQDPKTEALHHIRPYLVEIFPYIGLKHMPYKLVREMAIEPCLSVPVVSIAETAASVHRIR